MIDTLPETPRVRFTLPEELNAPAPPEARGVPRDQVRLLVAGGDQVHHARFHELGRFLDPGDLLVVNTSGTLPAAIDGVRGADPVVVHFSTVLDGGDRVVELRTAPDAGAPILDASPGERVKLGQDALGQDALDQDALGHDAPGHDALGQDVAVTLRSAYPRESGRNRLWRVTPTPGLAAHLTRYGRPIRYGYVAERWPLEAYQTVFATEPGSAEMPSAGRPFTPELVTRLAAEGIVIAPVTLHTGVSSQEAGEPPLPERFRVPAATARLVNWTRAQGRRVVAVGTTVTRALETAALPDGTVRAAQGWTDHVISPQQPVRVVDSLLTGLHAPDASHLLMLEAIAGPEVVQRAYDAALRHRYLWHEFGDLSLLHRPG